MVIENVTLIDAGNPIREEMTVIIDGDEIVSINKSNIGLTALLDDDVVSLMEEINSLSRVCGMPMCI